MGICQRDWSGNYFGKDLLENVAVIGRGSFGEVWKVRHKLDGNLYALKCILKAQTVYKNSVELVLEERKILSELDTPFVPKLVSAFLDEKQLFLLMELVEGVTLRQCLNQKYKFSEKQGMVIVVSILKMLEHMHSKNILHRDLKPENIILTEQGVRVVDLGIAKRVFRKENAGEMSGTLGYMAPETLFRQNYSRTSDYFSLGVILHEIIFGFVPYDSSKEKDLMKKFIEKNYEVNLEALPDGWSNESALFANKLIQVRPFDRLGARNINEIKTDLWFEKYGKWESFTEEKLQLSIRGVEPRVYEAQEAEPGKEETDEVVERMLNNPRLFKDFPYENPLFRERIIELLKSR